MFTGIVETTALIESCVDSGGCRYFTLSPNQVFDDLRIGDSVSVNGVCLTVTDFSKTTFNVAAVPETLKLTNLGHLKSGSEVNVERALKLGDRLGGHYVQGHVDTVGEIIQIEKEGDHALLVTISTNKNSYPYLVKKGYVTLDGMSITVIEVNQSSSTLFTVTFIPHTQDETVVKHYRVGTLINVELDILAKYVEKLLRGG
ncbi:MAG: riboflavin synthase [Gammaproteobacteria bacterium]|nr:riboflavin synthase [Gammaproteobacteria bacterium]